MSCRSFINKICWCCWSNEAKRRRNNETTDLSAKQRRNEEDGKFLQLMSSLLSAKEREGQWNSLFLSTWTWIRLNRTYSCESFVRFEETQKHSSGVQWVADRLQFILRWSEETFLISLVMRYCLPYPSVWRSISAISQLFAESTSDDREQSYSTEE